MYKAKETVKLKNEVMLGIHTSKIQKKEGWTFGDDGM